MIYLDFNSTTPLDERVFEAMSQWMTDRFWNAASVHAGGRAAEDAVEDARERVAGFVGAHRDEIVWTSGATESNNLALKGIVELASSERRRVLTVKTEHKSVFDSASWLQSRGVPVTFLPVHPDGSLRMDCLEAELSRADVALVSVMAANNETGVIADLATIADLVHEKGAILHSDATQAAGKIEFNIRSSKVDLASFSAHKMYGPKGVGALFVSRRIQIAPILHGGGHERGMRSGTTNVPGVIGFGVASDLATISKIGIESTRQRSLVELLVAKLTNHLEGVERVTSNSNVLPNTVSLRIVGADARAVMANAPGVAVSVGSTCTSLIPSSSHVLLAMGMVQAAVLECIRFSLGRSTTESEVSLAANQIVDAVQHVRNFRS